MNISIYSLWYGPCTLSRVPTVSAAVVAVDEGGAAHVVRAAGARRRRGRALRVRAHEGARREGARRGTWGRPRLFMSIGRDYAKLSGRFRHS